MAPKREPESIRIEDENPERVIPPSPSPFRAVRSPCDETSQTGASSSLSDFLAPSSTPTDTPRAHTPRLRSAAEHTEDGALEKTAHAAEGAIGTEERAKQAGSQVTHVCSSRDTFMKKKERTQSEVLLERFRDATCHSFPNFGTSKDGVPVPDPMSATRNRTVLNGGLTGGFNNLSKDSSKRQITEPLRVAKRQKTGPETAAATDVSAQAAFLTQGFAPPPTSLSLSPQTPTLVDLTNSQQSGDGDAASIRSTHSINSTANGSEFRDVEKVRNGVGKKSGSRPRGRRLHVRGSKKPEGYDCDIEDEIVQDHPVQDRRPRGESREGLRKKPYRQPPRRGADDITEVSEDDELAFQTGRSRRAGDDISDDDGKSPVATATKRKRGDMTNVKFEQSHPAIPRNLVLKVARAVSGRDAFEAKKPEECILLKLSQDRKSLVAFDQAGRHYSEGGWLDVKLMFCTKVFYSITGTQFAVIWRSSAPNVGGLLVLGFAEPGDAHRLGDWAEAKVKTFTTQRIDCSPKDSEYLRKIYEKQRTIAEKWEVKKDSQPDDIKLLEHKEAIKTAAKTTSVPWTQSKTSPPSNQPLRGNMRAEDSSRPSKPEITPSRSSNSDTTKSAYFALARYDTGTESRQTKELPPREARNTASKRLQESPLSIIKRKSPSPVSWIQQNPDWDKIWNEKPLIFPATGKNRASVYRDDISRLEEGEYLNDNLIGFYLRHLQVHLERENKTLSDRIYIMNTYFYPKLTDTKAGRGINYEGVKSWTAKVDLFSYDYIVVPVNESAHWYLAIICNPSKLLNTDDDEPEIKDAQSLDEHKESKETSQEKLVGPSSEEGMVSTVGEQVEQMSLDESQPSEQKKEEPRPGPEKKEKGPPTKQRQSRKSIGIAFRKQDPTEARVITLDSLGVGHSPTCGNLKAYLVREAQDKRNMEIEPPGTFGLTAKKIPEQEDHASCGAYLLGYMREFLKDPDGVVTKLVRKERLDWDITSPAMRSELRTIIIEQRKLQNATLAAERKAKRKSTGQPVTPGKVSDECHENEPAPPRTPQPFVVDVPKNPSSTVKGSPATGLPPTNRSSPPAKIEGSDATTLLVESESSIHDKPVTGIEQVSDIAQPVEVEQGSGVENAQRVESGPQHTAAFAPGPAVERPVLPGDTVLPTNEQCDVMRSLVDSLEPPATPIREASRTGKSTGVQLRTSPRHSRTKAVEVEEISMLPALRSTPAQSSEQIAPDSRGPKKKLGSNQKMLQPLASSPAQSAEQRKAGVRALKRKPSNSEQLLLNLSSPPPKAARKDEETDPQPPKGDSPSEQLLGELQSSSESMPRQSHKSGRDVKIQEGIIIQDPEPPKTSPRTLTETPAQKSSYFEARSPPRSARKRKQLSPQYPRARDRARPSIEKDTESSRNKIEGPANGSETVDLTVN